MSPIIKRSGFAIGLVACAGLAGAALFGNATADTLPPVTRLAQVAPQMTPASTNAGRKAMLLKY